MKLQKDIILPKIPSDASPEMRAFCQDIIKTLHSLNLAIHNEFKNFTVPQERTGGTRGAELSEPKNPSVGTMYYSNNYLYVCTAVDDGTPTWRRATLAAIT